MKKNRKLFVYMGFTAFRRTSISAVCLMLALVAPAALAEKPVKVYILSGQSNMVGIGQASPGGASKYNTFQTKDIDKNKAGSILSIYKGAYDPSVDYDKLEAVETHVARLGYWPHSSFPVIEGEQTHVLRGFIKVDRPGRYVFKSGNGSVLEVNGQVIYNSIDDKDATPKIVEYKSGVYRVKVIYPGQSRSGLSFQFFDVPGSLHSIVKDQGKYPHLLDKDGEWAVRDDVWYKGVVTAGANKWLSIGCGAGKSQIGPELGFGWQLGDYHDEPVLLLKASQGNRSLAWDFLPPGSERFEAMDKTKDGEMKMHVFAGYKDPKYKWLKGTEPEVGGWYAGKQYDECFDAAKDVLADFDQRFPHWKGRGYEIAGFVWWQGHKDGGSQVHIANYEKNLVHLINTLRSEFKAPNAPFVVGTVGFGGFEGMNENHKVIAAAQLAVSDSEKYPEFKGNVTTVETRGFWKDADESPKNQGFHYHQNGEVYYQVGDAFGKAMIELLTAE